MKLIKRLSTISTGLVLGLSSLMAISFAPLASAASTVTWTGGGSDGDWSTTANWAGGVAPTSGDSIIIDNSAIFTNGSKDDISGLSLNSITFTGNSTSGTVAVELDQDLTVTSAITEATSVSTTNDWIGGQSGGTSHNLILGGDVTVTSTGLGLKLGVATGDQVALGGHTLTFKDQGGSTANTLVINAVISGSGTVVYDGLATDYQIGATNTYSGNTKLLQSNDGVEQVTGTAPFGTSTVTIEPGSSATFNFASSATISNPIIVTGTQSGSPVTSLDFGTSGSASGPITLTVPNITLNGDTRFGNNGTTAMPVTINLAGIDANSHCIQYLPATNSGFENGPAACTVNASVGGTPTPKAPSAPDTGFALVSSHPIVTLGAVVLIAGAIVGLTQKARLASKRR